jgi:hypothetical protein
MIPGDRIVGRTGRTDGRKYITLSVALAVFLWAACLSWAAEDTAVYATIGPLDVLGSGPHYLDLGVGVANLSGSGNWAGAGKIELRVGKKLAFVGPAFGVFANNDGFRYGYAGIYADFGYGRFVLTPLLAAGVCHQGDRFDLGGPFEFRESLEIAYRLGERLRAGVSLAHISNADFYQNNPGQKDMLLTIAVGF